MSDYNTCCVKVKVPSGQEIKIGSYSPRVEELKKFASENSITDLSIQSDLHALEFMTIVREIFNEVLLNCACVITKDNIGLLKKFVFKRLDYFAKWKRFQEDARKSKVDIYITLNRPVR